MKTEMNKNDSFIIMHIVAIFMSYDKGKSVPAYLLIAL